MLTSILIPVAIDHGPLFAEKIAMARHLLEPNGRITLLTVLEKVPSYTQEFVTVKMENHLSARVMANLKELANGASDIDCRVETGKPGIRICEIARDIDADLIIIGAHNPTAADYFLGSTASRVARRAPCSVYIARQAAAGA